MPQLASVPRSIALVTILCSMGTPSSIPNRSIRPEMRSEPKIRIRVVFEREVEPR